MIEASHQDKPRVTEILARSFDQNQSANCVIPQDSKRDRRIQALMNYSFDVCCAFGDVFLSEDRRACALAVRPEKKKTTLNSILWDARLVLSCTGLGNVGKTLRRESQLLAELIDHSQQLQRPICLETSTISNLPWYKKFGFHVYAELDMGYRLYFLKRDFNV